MRMRKKKNAAKRLDACADIFIADPASQKGAWKKLSGGRDIYIEIGCGKGTFVFENAKRHPELFFVAFEKVKDVIVMAMEKVHAEALSNVLFVCDDAENITDFFEENEVNGIYLNFSDPWPKKKHAKRRLTYITFLEKYKNILVDGGKIFFKTDNRQLFDFSLEQFALAGLEISDVTYDLHNSEYESENIHTEYENNFSAKGFTINRAVAAVDKKNNFANTANGFKKNNFADTGHDIENNKTKSDEISDRSENNV